MASGSVLATLPSLSLFTVPPSPQPPFLPPPPPGSTSAAPPIAISPRLYQAVLDPRVPLTIAALYAVTAKLLTAYNRSRNKQPWAISKTRAFHAFVVAHNIFLAVYSAWTWWGMLSTLRRSLVNPLGAHGPAGFADSVCRLHGPPGRGHAHFFAEENKAWQKYTLGSSTFTTTTLPGTPSPLDRGRIWNEGLAFYGWLFYLSKFYEVLDTFIILAKGKFSSTLQTYHHAGAIMCMWAGMRYMSPPIWIFVFFNSGIHAMMYTYYTLTAFNVRVPVFIKRTLTTLQITQFLVGASSAMVHSFVSYTIPADTTTAAAAAATTTTPGATLLDNIKAALFKTTSSPPPTHSSFLITPCITTSGQTFAIWLNVLYLAPLTWLFVKFFIASYLRHSSADYKKKQAEQQLRHQRQRRLSNELVHAEKAGWDAARSVEREIYNQGEEVEERRQEKKVEEKVEGEKKVLRKKSAVRDLYANGKSDENGNGEC